MSKTQIIVHIVDQTVRLANRPTRLASGSEGALQVRCDFCSLWAGYGKTAVFYRDEDQVYHVPMVDNVADVPCEVLATPGHFFFGIMGAGENIRTTEVVRVNVTQGALTTATAEPEDPTPDIYQQLLAAYGALETAISVERARINNLVTAETLDHETIDIRVGYDGRIYPTAGAAVREQVGDIHNVLSEHHSNIEVIDNETIDIRVGYDGTTYDSAGEAVRGQVGDIHNALIEYHYNIEAIAVVNEAQNSDIARLKDFDSKVINDDDIGDYAWSSKHIADTLCPALEESGSLIHIKPVNKYPLSISTTTEEAGGYVSRLELHHSGVNLLPIQSTPSQTINGVTFTNNGDGTVTANGTATADATYLYYNNDTNVVPFLECGMRLSGCPAGGSRSKYWLWLGWIGLGDFGNGYNIEVSEAQKAYWSRSISITVYAGYTAENLVFKPMISAGHTAYHFEPYRGETVISVDFTSTGEKIGNCASFDWNTLIFKDETDEWWQYVLADSEEPAHFVSVDKETYTPIRLKEYNAFPGLNTIYVTFGNTTVSGRKDLVGVIEDLTNAIIALGGNV